jgi:hypothetical protein
MEENYAPIKIMPLYLTGCTVSYMLQLSINEVIITKINVYISWSSVGICWQFLKAWHHWWQFETCGLQFQYNRSKHAYQNIKLKQHCPVLNYSRFIEYFVFIV